MFTLASFSDSKKYMHAFKCQQELNFTTVNLLNGKFLPDYIMFMLTMLNKTHKLQNYTFRMISNMIKKPTHREKT